MNIRFVHFAALLFINSICIAQADNKQESGRPKGDSVVIKAYRDVITSKAKTSVGLITVHKVNNRYYFEIADSLLNRDMLLTSRISKGPALGITKPGLPGDLINEVEIRFSKGGDNSIFIQK